MDRVYSEKIRKKSDVEPFTITPYVKHVQMKPIIDIGNLASRVLIVSASTKSGGPGGLPKNIEKSAF